MIIAGKAIGRRKPLFAEWSMPMPPELRDGDGQTLREVISSIVVSEVNAFREGQSDRQFLQVLTARDIEAGAERGKVTMGLSEAPVQEVDEAAAIATALQAFEDGIYLVVLDGLEHRDLNAQVYLQPESRVTFIRLTLLAGG